MTRRTATVTLQYEDEDYPNVFYVLWASDIASGVTIEILDDEGEKHD